MRQAMYLLTCLFFALSCSKTNLTAPEPAQAEIASLANESLNKDHEVAVPHLFSQPLSMPIFCGQIQVDVLSGYLTDQHCTMFGHFNPEYPDNLDMFVWQWMIHRFYGEWTSKNTGEIFKMEQTRKVTPDDVAFVVSFSANLIGNQGTHYITSGSFLRYPPYTMTIDKALCLENGRSK